MCVHGFLIYIHVCIRSHYNIIIITNLSYLYIYHIYLFLHHIIIKYYTFIKILYTYII